MTRGSKVTKKEVKESDDVEESSLEY